MQVIRDGQVVVANALGSGFLEAADVAAIPARRLPVSYWAKNLKLGLRAHPGGVDGRGDDFKYVESHLDQLGDPPRLPASPRQGSCGSRFDRRRPSRNCWRKCEPDPVSSSPRKRSLGSTGAGLRNGDVLQPWHVTLRAFAAASDGNYQGHAWRVALRVATGR